MKKIALIVSLVFLLAGCTSQKKMENDKTQTAVAQEKEQNNTDKMTKVLLKTSLGDIIIELSNETPQHRDNFIKLVNEKYYDGVLFHRIIQGFMIQTGDPDSKTAKPGQRLGMGGPSYRIPAEFVPSLYHKRGAVAAARDNNPQKASSGSQFYIVDGKTFDETYLSMIEQRTGKTFTPEQKQVYSTMGGAPFLDGDYTVFGMVLEGMDIVDKIAAQPKDPNDRPMEDIKIISATIIE